jgi:hypothetical protein
MVIPMVGITMTARRPRERTPTRSSPLPAAGKDSPFEAGRTAQAAAGLDADRIAALRAAGAIGGRAASR